jgi:glycosyltransferase involved in cell wall biosynthesis
MTKQLRVKMSVIIPTHGRVTLFKQTLQCLAAQTSSEFEIIITDDSSEEKDRNNIKAAIKQFKKKNIPVRYIFTRSNLLQALNTNQGLKEARGKYLRILHSDDLLAPQCIAKEISVFEANPDIDFFYHHAIQFSNDIKFSSAEQSVTKIDPRIWLNRYIFTRTVLPTCLAFRRELYKRVGGMDEKYKFLCDWQLFLDFLLDAYKNNKQTLHIEKCYVGWRVHQDSITSSLGLTHFTEHEDFIKKLKLTYQKNNILSPQQLQQNIKIAEAYRYKRILEDHIKYGNFPLPPNMPFQYKYAREMGEIRDRIKIILFPLTSILRWLKQPFAIGLIILKLAVKIGKVAFYKNS